MKKFWLLMSTAAAALALSPQASAADTPAYGDLYNVEWCPCNPEEPFDADGSVVMGKTVMCPCSGMYSGYKKGFDEDIRDIKRSVGNQVRKLNYFKYYIGMDYNITSLSAGKDQLSFDDVQFADGPIKLKPDDIFDDQDNLAFVLGARISKNFGLEAFYEQSYNDNTTTQIDHNTLNAGTEGYYLMNEYTTSYKAYGLDLIGYIPLSQYFDIVGSFGVAQYKFENEANFGVYKLGNLEETIHKEFNEDKIGWRAALGGQVNLGEGVALRAMYRYVSLGGKTIDDLSEVSLGVRFLF